MVVLETALPIKFAATVVEALGRDPVRPSQFEGIEALPKRVLVMDADVPPSKRSLSVSAFDLCMKTLLCARQMCASSS